MTPLSEIKFSELLTYLTNNYVFGLTGQKRKNTIIYSFSRFIYSKPLRLKVKVMRETKCVMSVMCNGKIYTDFDDVKTLIGK